MVVYSAVVHSLTMCSLLTEAHMQSWKCSKIAFNINSPILQKKNMRTYGNVLILCFVSSLPLLVTGDQDSLLHLPQASLHL